MAKDGARSKTTKLTPHPPSIKLKAMIKTIQRTNETPTRRQPNRISKKFGHWSEAVDKIVGSPYWFVFSVILILIWIPSGIFFGFNEIWHLIINTTTTILTFLMMSLLHASQSEWEKKMDRIQDREKEILRTINKELESTVKALREISKNSPNKENI